MHCCGGGAGDDGGDGGDGGKDGADGQIEVTIASWHEVSGDE